MKTDRKKSKEAGMEKEGMDSAGNRRPTCMGGEMAQFNYNLMYEFHARDLTNMEAIRMYADHAVHEIKTAIGWDADVAVNIEPEAKDKHLFSVSMSVFGLGDSIVVRKEGKQVMAVLRKVRKAVLRQIHRLNEERFDSRRKTFFREQFAS